MAASPELHVVTGANGYIGSLLCRALAGQGHRVRGIDITEGNQTGAAIDFRTCDVTNAEKTAAACAGAAAIYHTAALVPISRHARSRLWQVNHGGTVNVLRAAARAGARRFCYLSSSAVFGVADDSRPHIAAESPHSPVEPYGRSKAAAETYLLTECARLGVRLAIVRPRTILGRERLGLFHLVFNQIRRGKNVYLIGEGLNRLQFTHVDDVVEVMVAAVRHGKSGIFQVGASDFGSVKEDLAALAAHAGSKSKIICLPSRPAIGLLRALDLLRLSPLSGWHYLTSHKTFVLDTSRTREELAWTPKMSNFEMLAESYDWFAGLPAAPAFEGAHAHRPSPHRSAAKQRLLRFLP
jgi:nucleoside-diphosphate-sugar epimerase